MVEVSFTHRTTLVLDARTAAEVMQLAEASTPPRTQAEMWRHLIRLGLVEYRRQEQEAARD